MAPCVVQTDGTTCAAISQANPLPTRGGGSVAAASTACSVVATSSAATATGCSSAGSAGSYIVGPFTPSLGYAIRLVSKGTWTGSVQVATSTDSCATYNGLTAGGIAYGTFTANANEMVDVAATTGGVTYCLVLTVGSGSLTAALRN
jgi:hypothetical protein